jgi:hypothetical protein
MKWRITTDFGKNFAAARKSLKGEILSEKMMLRKSFDTKSSEGSLDPGRN